jgi:hypothetical protein
VKLFSRLVTLMRMTRRSEFFNTAVDTGCPHVSILRRRIHRICTGNVFLAAARIPHRFALNIYLSREWCWILRHLDVEPFMLSETS